MTVSICVGIGNIIYVGICVYTNAYTNAGKKTIDLSMLIRMLKTNIVSPYKVEKLSSNALSPTKLLYFAIFSW